MLIPVSELRPMLCECKNCGRQTPHFLFSRARFGKPLSHKSLLAVCYDCLGASDTDKTLQKMMAYVAQEERYSYMLSGNIPEYDAAREVILHCLQALKYKELHRQRETEQELTYAAELKLSNSNAFEQAISADTRIMTSAMDAHNE